jgi:hypothetical protein
MLDSLLPGCEYIWIHSSSMREMISGPPGLCFFFSYLQPRFWWLLIMQLLAAIGFTVL